jgi:ankyrin repeat protein
MNIDNEIREFEWYTKMGNDLPYNLRSLDYAIEYNNLPLLEFLYSKGIRSSALRNGIEEAAKRGYPDILKFLYLKNEKGTQMAVDLAAANGHFEVLKYLYEVIGLRCTATALDYAAISSKNADIVKYLLKKKAPYTDKAIHHAIIYKNENILNLFPKKLIK